MGPRLVLSSSSGAGGKTPIFTTGIDEFQRIVDQSLRPLFLAVRTAVPQLLQAGSGAVIAIASMYGLVGQYVRVAYCGAKACMIGMVRWRSTCARLHPADAGSVAAEACRNAASRSDEASRSKPRAGS